MDYDVLIVGVTKTHGVEVIRQGLEAGMCDFGENRVQEFLGKYGLFPTAHWHFIGTLQTNKAKHAVRLFAMRIVRRGLPRENRSAASTRPSRRQRPCGGSC